MRAKYLYLLILILAVAVVSVILTQDRNRPQTISLREMASLVQKGQITRLTVQGDRLIATLPGGQAIESFKEPRVSALEALQSLGVEEPRQWALQLEVKQDEAPVGWGLILGIIAPVVLMGAFTFYMFRRARNITGDMIATGKSRARLANPDRPRVTFDDVAGVEEAKEELQE
ncbi:MAG: ATP-dependent metallopeptidase FtsH/Yme1/Tma family protein, partial [Anaerolineae bacterium]